MTMCNTGAAVVTATEIVTEIPMITTTKNLSSPIPGQKVPPGLKNITTIDADKNIIADNDIAGDDEVEEEQAFSEDKCVTSPSMQNEVGPDGQGFEIRSKQRIEQGEIASDLQSLQRQRSVKMSEISEERDAGLDCKEFKIPPEQVERQRSGEKSKQKSDQESDRYLGHASTFDRPPIEHPSIHNVNSMPSHTRSPKSKKPPTFGKMLRPFPVLGLPKDKPIGDRDISKYEVKKVPNFGKGIRPCPVLGLPKDESIGDTNISKDKTKEAKELTKFAIKALDIKDIDIAVKRLKEALVALGQ